MSTMRISTQVRYLKAFSGVNENLSESATTKSSLKVISCTHSYLVQFFDHPSLRDIPSQLINQRYQL